jgi:uncharacterized membrane protein YqhA
MRNLFKLSGIIVLILCLFSCDAYIEFEKMRLKFIMWVFIITLVVGLIGMIFSNSNNDK